MLSINLSLWPWKLRLAFLPVTIPPCKCQGSFQFSALHKEFFMFSIFNLLLFTVTVMTLGSETSQELMTNLTKITPSAAADNRSAPDLTWPAGTNLPLKLGDVLWVTWWEMSFVPGLMAYLLRVGLPPGWEAPRAAECHPKVTFMEPSIEAWQVTKSSVSFCSPYRKHRENPLLHVLLFMFPPQTCSTCMQSR